MLRDVCFKKSDSDIQLLSQRHVSQVLIQNVISKTMNITLKTHH